MRCVICKGSELTRKIIDEEIRAQKFLSRIPPISQAAGTAKDARNAEQERWFDNNGMNTYNNSMNTVVSEKGQITIPKALRDRLGIRPGQVLDFREEAGRLVAVKRLEKDSLDSVYGILGLETSTDDLMEQLRGKAGLP